MSSKTYRQGAGATHTVHATIPTTNVDGSAYVHGAEDYFNFYISNDAATPKQTLVGAVEIDPATNAVNRTENVDAMTVGDWFITMSTVNVDPATGDKIEGPVSPTPLQLVILAPLVAPLHPDNIQ